MDASKYNNARPTSRMERYLWERGQHNTSKAWGWSLIHAWQDAKSTDRAVEVAMLAAKRGTS